MLNEKKGQRERDFSLPWRKRKVKRELANKE